MEKYVLIESVINPGSFFSGDGKFKNFFNSIKFKNTELALEEIENASRVQPCKLIEIYEN